MAVALVEVEGTALPLVGLVAVRWSCHISPFLAFFDFIRLSLPHRNDTLLLLI